MSCSIAERRSCECPPVCPWTLTASLVGRHRVCQCENERGARVLAASRSVQDASRHPAETPGRRAAGRSFPPGTRPATPRRPHGRGTTMWASRAVGQVCRRAKRCQFRAVSPQFFLQRPGAGMGLVRSAHIRPTSGQIQPLSACPGLPFHLVHRGVRRPVRARRASRSRRPQPARRRIARR